MYADSASLSKKSVSHETAQKNALDSAEDSSSFVDQRADSLRQLKLQEGISSDPPTAQLASIAGPQVQQQESNPTLGRGTKKDDLTTAGDITSITHGAVGATNGGAEIARFAGESGEVLDTIGVIGDIAGLVGIGLSIFGIAENAVRYKDAKIRLAAFTKAYLEMENRDTVVATYLKEAIIQQDLEASRRWKRVAVTTVILGLAISALIVGTASTAGIVLGVIGMVLAVGKAYETIRNLYRKRQAKQKQKEQAKEILQGLLNPSEKAAVETMLDGLGISQKTDITPDDVRAENKVYSKTIDLLYPHLGRADDALKEAIAKEGDEIMEKAIADAEKVIAAQDEQEE